MLLVLARSDIFKMMGLLLMPYPVTNLINHVHVNTGKKLSNKKSTYSINFTLLVDIMRYIALRM